MCKPSDSMSELGHYVMWCNLFDWGYRRMFGESRSQLAGILHNWNMLYRSVGTALRISFTFKCMPHVVKNSTTCITKTTKLGDEIFWLGYILYCRACAASDMGLSASVPLPIVMGIFVLLGFQSS